MTPREVATLLDQVIALNTRGKHIVIFLHGPVGVAKSAVVQAAADRNEIEFLDVRLARLDVTDLTGAMQVKGGKTYFAPPGWLPTSGRGILFFDEYPQAMTALQNIGGQVIYDRRVGEYVLPDGWIVVVAGNRQSDRAGTTNTPQQINNRCVHVTMDVSFDDWLDWAREAGIHDAILSFLGNNRQELLSRPSKDREAFPSLRTWEYVSNILMMELPTHIRNETICGAIGEGEGHEFCGYLEVFDDIPNWQEILKNPKGADLPEGPAPTYALMNVLARNVSIKTIDNLVLYLNRINTEMATLCMNFVERFHPVLKETKAFTKWQIDNQ